MKDGLTAAAPTEPARTNSHAPRFAAHTTQFCELEELEPLREVRENFAGHFAAESVGAKDARHRDSRGLRCLRWL